MNRTYTFFLIPTTPVGPNPDMFIGTQTMEESQRQHIDQLLEKLWTGEISAEELRELREWTYRSDENDAYTRHFVQVAMAADIRMSRTQFDTDQAIVRFHQRCFQAQEKFSLPDQPQEGRLRRNWLYIAAAVVLVLVILVPWKAYRYGSDTVKKEFAQFRFTAPNGSKVTMALPDGSMVTLNAGSSLVCSQGFGITNREMILHGEGQFKVAHRQDLPFTVKTRELVAHDIGTEFILTNYDEDPTARLVLMDGIVSLNNLVAHTSSIAKEKGECLVLDKHTGEMTRTLTTISAGQAGHMDILSFENKPLGSIAHELQRYYGVRIIVSKGVAGKRFYGYFNRQHDSIDDIFRDLSSTGQFSYRKDKDNIYYLSK